MCIKLIDEILDARATQNETDKIYEKFLKIITDEMSDHFKKMSQTPRSKRAYRHVAKELWDEEAEILWKEMRDAEHKHLNTPRNDKKYKARFHSFITKQQTFDKAAKAKKRRTQRNKVKDIEKANTSDPTAFWNYIKNLTPRNKKEIPWETVIDG